MSSHIWTRVDELPQPGWWCRWFGCVVLPPGQSIYIFDIRTGKLAGMQCPRCAGLVPSEKGIL